jgi:hypothetical protein
MDELEVEIRNETEIWVKFQNFRAGEAEKIVLALSRKPRSFRVLARSNHSRSQKERGQSKIPA